MIEHDKSASIRDVTNEVGKALIQAANDGREYSSGVYWLFGEEAISTVLIYLEFYDLVNHNAAWDIKQPNPWESTIGTPFPGKGVKVSFGELIMTPEQLGNYTYGFLGYAYQIPLDHLIGGSYYAAGFPTNGAALENELQDWFFVYLGYSAAEVAYKEVGVT